MVSAVMTWPGHRNRKPGGYGMTKLAQTSAGPSFDAPVNLRAVELQAFALLFTVRAKEPGPHIAFTGNAGGIFTQAVMEAAEIREIRHVFT